MKRDEAWKALIEAETNVDYYGRVANVCRWIAIGTRVVLILGTLGSMIVVFADHQAEKALTITAFVAACIDVVILPFFKFSEVCKRSEKFRNEWIDLREKYRGIWFDYFHTEAEANADAEAGAQTQEGGEKLRAKVVTLEKSKDYVPTFQRWVDRCSKRAHLRYGVEVRPCWLIRRLTRWKPPSN